jgi:hypothetical protein
MFRKTTILFTVSLCVLHGAFGASDYQLTWGNNGSVDYSLDSVSSTDVFDGSLGASDPTIMLEVGKRYGMTIVNPIIHPFEVLAKGNGSSSKVMWMWIGLMTVLLPTA